MFVSRATTLACKAGYIFLHFSGERRQAQSEQGASDTRERGRYLEELQKRRWGIKFIRVLLANGFQMHSIFPITLKLSAAIS